MDLIACYFKQGYFPEMQRFFENKREISFTSEDRYEHLEPWIQWVSFYTGKSYGEHGCFHLGDYSEIDENDFFSRLADAGKRTGIFGAMNHPGTEKQILYVPDPWSQRESDRSLSSRATQKVTNLLVNKNAQLSSPLAVVVPLLIMFFSTKGLKKFSVILRSMMAFIKRDRARLSAYFDFFFLMFCVSRHGRQHLDISSIFLNGFAHVQHHYMLSSSLVEGHNPEWYVGKNVDPLFNALGIYNEMFGWLNSQSSEVSVLTGLSQEPYPKPEIYWRFTDHHFILKQILPAPFEVFPRMTRDFHVEFENEEDASQAMEILETAQICYGDKSESAFGYLDKKNNTIFCSFIYEGDSRNVNLVVKDKHINLAKQIIFVAIKNAGHVSQGWAYFPRSVKFGRLSAEPKIWQLKDIYLSHFGISR